MGGFDAPAHAKHSALGEVGRIGCMRAWCVCSVKNVWWSATYCRDDDVDVAVVRGVEGDGGSSVVHLRILPRVPVL